MTRYYPVARILLHQLSGAGITYGLVTPDEAAILSADPTAVAVVALAVGAFAEGLNALIKRLNPAD